MPKAAIHFVLVAALAISLTGTTSAADAMPRFAANATPAAPSLALAPSMVLAQASEPAAAAATDAAAQDQAAEPGPIPLEENGLIAQILAQVDRWNDSVEIQIRQLIRVLGGIPSMLDGIGSRLADSADQALVARGLLILASIFAVGLGMEWLLRRLLAGPRSSFIRHAHQQGLHPQPHAPLEPDRQPAPGTEQQMMPTSAPSTAADMRQDQKEAGMHASVGGAALVRVQRDGVELVEPVPLDANASPPAPAGPVHAGDAANSRLDQAGIPGEAAAVASVVNKPESAGHITLRNLSSRLRQLPLALAVLLLDLLPLTVFFLATAVLLHWLGRNDMNLREIVHTMVGAYVGMRAATAVLRLVVAPPDCGIPVLSFRAEVTDVLYHGLRRIIATAALGIALAGVAHGLDAAGDGRLVMLKLVSLVVHLQAIVLIYRLRLPVAATIAGTQHPDGPLATARAWLAETWATFAAILVAGTWVVWALGVEDGFPRLLHFVGVTVGIIIAARVLAILILGLLSRMFHGREDAGDASAADGEGGAERFFPLVQRIVVVLISIGTVVALLQAWGIDVIGWMMERPIGRGLFSAVVTISIAVVAGITVWEVANSTVERRLKTWQGQGETVRAARLRTLLPILRTCLFIVIILIVGLTALNEVGVNTTPLLASASIVGVALGFGSQKLVQDFITGIFLLMENAMQVGDWVTVAGVSGIVEDLSIRTVRLRAGDGSLHIVPFSSVSTVNNTNRGLGNAAMRVSVVYGTDIAVVMDELREIGKSLQADPAFSENMLGELEIWGVDAVDGSSVTLAGQIRCTAKGRWGVQRELNRRILERFRQLNIVIADPRATVLLSREAPAPVVSAVQQPTPNDHRKSTPEPGMGGVA